MSEATASPSELKQSNATLGVRGLMGGFLMGLANLVPGISGGTMLLAAGVYPQFINGVAEVTTLRFKLPTLVLLGAVIIGAIVAIGGFAGVVGMMVIEHRWVMYSAFIGLTLGGVPVIWRLVKPIDSVVVLSSIAGILGMAAIALVEPGSSASEAATGPRAYAMLALAGVAGGSAMILPGVSGGYLLLVLGQYLIILTAIDAAADGLRTGDWTLAFEQVHVFLPVGVGVLIGIVGVSNLIRVLLTKYEKATLGFLLGLLLGAVFGLWPFQEAIQPQVGDLIKGMVLETEEMVLAVEQKDWPTRHFRPQATHLLGSFALVVVGFLISTGIAWVGRANDAGSK